MNRSKILCYNISTETLAALTREAKKLNAETVSVAPESYGLPLLSVASGVKASANPLASSTLPEGMLVFVNFPDTMLDVFLGVLREKGIRVSLKAILTQHNAVWDAHTLYNELCRERAELSNK
ncbi:MAG: DUF3783 domain-containing protein [Clostridia bacterium]|nr:DUF3783 domain-containing protein [Clostridia bacterium]